MRKTFGLALIATLIPLAYADQGGFSNTGSTVTNPPGTLNISGATLTFLSTDGSMAINATFTTSSLVENCSGGGKGGHITCAWTFKGTFSGTLTVNGAPQAINGSTYQVSSTSSEIGNGSTAYNSAYTPFYFSNTGQLVRSDDLNGTNLTTYGTQGSGTGQFYGAYGVALDGAGRIYVADTYNDRVVRIDDFKGTNWTAFGSYGSGTGQFANPGAISIDPSGRIYVMDTGNSRLVRMDDMNGANWTTINAIGSGVGQFAQYSTAPAFDASGRIYIADTGNKRIVRMDDLSGTNWITLTQSPVIYIYIYTFGNPIGVAVDSAGKIYVADGTSVIRVDDMTGANWTSIALGTGATPHSIAIDSKGMVLVGGGGAQIVDSMLGVSVSGSTLTDYYGGYGPYYVFGATPVPLPTPRPSAIGFNPSTLTFSQNVGSTSAPQTIAITNFGGSPINGLAISASAGFSQTNNCPAYLAAASSCTVNVAFTPPAAGAAAGSLTITDDSGNLGSSQTLALSGTGTAPGISITPTSLSFQSQAAGTTSNAKTITVLSNGTGPLQISSVAATAPFSETDNCTGSIAPGASCTIQVKFAPAAVGSFTGSITVTDNAGTQTVALSGNGSAPVSLSPSSLSFGNVAAGSTSSARTVTVTNRLSAALTLSSVAVSGPFAVASNTCGASIAANANCAIGITFTPTGLGAATGVLTLTDSAVTSPQTVALSGTGVAPVTLSTNSITFSTQVVGNTSPVRTVTLTNNQTTALNFTSIAASAGFGVASNTCGASIAAGANCAVGVTFSPTAIGAATGTLTFNDSAPSSPQTVSLSGTGSAPLTLSNSSFNYPAVTVGTTSGPRTETLTNHSGAAIAISSVVASAGFNVASNNCGTSIAAGASCSVNVTFTPKATGTVTGTLTFTDAAVNSPQVVTLTGTGITGGGGG
jgi:sugar lactone lactonase YvrE